VAVRGGQHGDLDVLCAQPGDAAGPLTLDRGSPFECQAKLDEKWNGGIEGFDHDANVVHPLHSHISTDPLEIGKIQNDALYLAQGEKDAAVLANAQALRNYWTSYYHLRRVTLYDFEKKQEMADAP
jgi:hypothetical protein